MDQTKVPFNADLAAPTSRSKSTLMNARTYPLKYRVASKTIASRYHQNGHLDPPPAMLYKELDLLAIFFSWHAAILRLAACSYDAPQKR